MNRNVSLYDPTRKNVGSIYRDLQIKDDHYPIEVGNMGEEILKSLIDDINEALTLPRETDDPFYLLVIEKRDLQMPKSIYRHRQTLNYRPYPEDNTTVFWKDPKAQEVRFCWQLPHWAEMDLILAHEEEFDPQYISHIKAWKNNDLRVFGFYYDPVEKWIPNPRWKDLIVSS